MSRSTSPLRQQQPEWFVPDGSAEVADPRRPPHRFDVAVPRFGQTALADALSDWWIELLTRLTRAGIAGFRCLTLDLVPASFWRRMTATFPEALFLAWTPGVTKLRAFAGIGFDLTCSSAGWWDGRASWFLDEQAALLKIAPAVGVTRAVVPRAPGAAASAGCRYRRGLSSGAPNRGVDRCRLVPADGL